MINRIAGHIQHWEQLMKLPEDPVPQEKHCSVSQVNPIRMMIQKEWLVDLVRQNLASIDQNREEFDTTPERKAFTDTLIAQRHRFLEELAEMVDEDVFMAFYPADLMVDGTDEATV